MSKAQVITNDELVRVLKAKIGEKTVKAFAAESGVSFQFLYHVLAGKYEVGPKVAGLLGYQQITTFRRIPRVSKKPNAPRQAKA